MLVLPRMTAPAVAQPLGDVRVVRRAVALEDPRAGGALAAGHGDEVLERDRDAEQRLEPVERVRRVRRAAVARRQSAASASASARSRSIDSQALRPWLSRSAAARCASVSSRDEISPVAQEAGHLVGEEPGRIGHRGRRHGRSALVEDGRDDDEVAVARGRVGQDGLDRQRRADDVVAQDVLELDRLGGRRDVVGGQLGEDRVLVEDVVELPPRAASARRRSGPRRARCATCSTSERDRVAMAR